MFFEVILEVVVIFDPELPIRVHNKLHQLPDGIAYMNFGIVPLAASAFFFLPTHCFPELITTFTLSALGVIFRDYNKGGQLFAALLPMTNLYQTCKIQYRFCDLYYPIWREGNYRLGRILVTAITFDKKIHLRGSGLVINCNLAHSDRKGCAVMLE